jgi:cytochrome c oxidase subunit 2
VSLPASVLALALFAPILSPVPARSEPAPAPRRIEVTAKRFEFTPAELVLERGAPVLLQLRALDRAHGFWAPELGIKVRLEPGQTVEVPFTPAKAGTFGFHCFVFCGSGHEEMTGSIVVKEGK